MWYFGSHGEYVDRQARVPPPGCHALAEYDPDGFRLLGLIYGGTHPLLRHDAVAPVTRLSPVAAAAVSGGGDEDAELPSVTLHFANLRGEAEAELWWADALLPLHAFLLLRLPPPPPSSSSSFLLLPEHIARAAHTASTHSTHSTRSTRTRAHRHMHRRRRRHRHGHGHGHGHSSHSAGPRRTRPVPCAAGGSTRRERRTATAASPRGGVRRSRPMRRTCGRCGPLMGAASPRATWRATPRAAATWRPTALACRRERAPRAADVLIVLALCFLTGTLDCCAHSPALQRRCARHPPPTASHHGTRYPPPPRPGRSGNRKRAVGTLGRVCVSRACYCTHYCLLQRYNNCTAQYTV
jgi:hypothetical protein